MQAVLKSGDIISLLSTQPFTKEMCKLEDLVFQISNMNRYAGSAGGYSVAQHSWLVSYLSPHPYEGLMHDLHEAITTDVPTPIKEVLDHLGNGAWTQFETSIAARVRRRYAANVEVSAVTKEADLLARRIEVACLFSPRAQKSFRQRGVEPLHGHQYHIYEVWSPQQAFKKFMERYKQVGSGIL